MLEVTNARHQEGFKIWVEFNDGTSGTVDLSDALWGPVFEPLRDVERLKRFSVSDVLHTVVWDNGADLAPEYLYDRLANNALQATPHSRQT